MALPTSRNTTYAPSSMLKSLDLNDIQDQIVASNQHFTTTGNIIAQARLKETAGATDTFRLRVPTGWDTAATGDATVDIPPQAQVFSGAEMGVHGFGSWTPALNVSGIGYTARSGFYQRVGNLCYAQFRIVYTATPAQTFVLEGFPFPLASSVRGFTVAVDTSGLSMPVGTVWSNNAGAIWHVWFIDADSCTFVSDSEGAQATSASGELVGQIIYPVA